MKKFFTADTAGKRDWELFISQILPVVFFAALWLFLPVGIYNDSDQYLKMHIHREPLYPLFLWLLRLVWEQEASLNTAVFLQNALAAFSVIYMVRSLRAVFPMKKGTTILSCLLFLAPHVITPLFAATHLVLTCGIMSEAIGLSLFYLFQAQCLRMFFSAEKEEAKEMPQQTGRGIKTVAGALILALLLALTRGQMMTAILVWAIVAFAAYLRGQLTPASGQTGKAEQPGKSFKGARRHLCAAAVICAAVLLAFGGRTLFVRTYNAAFNGAFINNTYGGVGLLANVLYAADYEDGALIEDEEARYLFYLSYEQAQEQGATYAHAPKGLMNRAAHLEEWHDTIKFTMIEQTWRDYHDVNGPFEYIPENQESDRIAMLIVKDILPSCLGTWICDYLALSVYGLLRSVAVVHPLLNWVGIAAYLIAAVFLIVGFVKNKKTKAGWILLFGLLCILANVYATSLMIMCLSRYMIYGLPMFYTGLLLVLAENCYCSHSS